MTTFKSLAQALQDYHENPAENIHFLALWHSLIIEYQTKVSTFLEKKFFGQLNEVDVEYLTDLVFSFDSSKGLMNILLKNPSVDIKTYLLRAAFNKAIDHLKQKGKFLHTDDLDSLSIESIPPEEILLQLHTDEQRVHPSETMIQEVNVESKYLKIVIACMISSLIKDENAKLQFVQYNIEYIYEKLNNLKKEKKSIYKRINNVNKLKNKYAYYINKYFNPDSRDNTDYLNKVIAKVLREASIIRQYGEKNLFDFSQDDYKRFCYRFMIDETKFPFEGIEMFTVYLAFIKTNNAKSYLDTAQGRAKWLGPDWVIEASQLAEALAAKDYLLKKYKLKTEY